MISGSSWRSPSISTTASSGSTLKVQHGPEAFAEEIRFDRQWLEMGGEQRPPRVQRARIAAAIEARHHAGDRQVFGQHELEDVHTSVRIQQRFELSQNP